MIPIYRQSDIKAFDDSLAAKGLLEAAISRAGYSVFVLAGELIGGSFYGKRVTAIYGPGNNGRDALVAAKHLRSAGVAVELVRYGSPEYVDASKYRGVDLVIDGCFGVGLSRPFEAPPLPESVRVLAVDVPSGLDGESGSVIGSAVNASATLCLSGLKLGPLISDGPDISGEVYVADLGLGELGPPSLEEYLIEDSDLSHLISKRMRSDHKWSHSMAVIAGSPGMDGAANLVCMAGYHVGAGIIHLYTDLSGSPGDYGLETVVHHVNFEEIDDTDREELFRVIAKRFKAMVIGPGLGRGAGVRPMLQAAIKSKVRLVIDADAIWAIPSIDWLAELVGAGHPGVVMTPHSAELQALLERSGAGLADSFAIEDRCSFARDLASRAGVSLLLKGGPTVVASPKGECYVTTAPDQSLAVAGSGDVLSGMIGAALTYSGDVAKQAAVTAHLHGLAGRSLGTGPSGEIAGRARRILRRFERGISPAPREFTKPTKLEGSVVARSELIGDRTFRAV